VKAPKVYSYSKCSTCRKALRWLDEHGVAYESTDIVTKPPSKKELKLTLERSGLPLSKLFNTSGQSYREGKWGERLKTTSTADALEALASDGKLIKRPLVFGDDFALVGFSEGDYAARFAKKKR
jgi:arsenate reductase (glutaredoxin)